MKKNAVIFGAGNIGRGFLGQLFFYGGYNITFIEANLKVVNLINENKNYIIKIIGDNPAEHKISRIKAVSVDDINEIENVILNSDLCATAVGVNNIKNIIPLVKAGLIKRCDNNINKSLNLIICENLLNASEIIKEEILKNMDVTYKNYTKKYLGLVESVVSRMVPVMSEEEKEKNPLLIRVEEYCVLPVDKKGFVGVVPEISGIVPYENLKAYEERKLFIHNAGHAIVPPSPLSIRRRDMNDARCAAKGKAPRGGISGMFPPAAPAAPC